MKNSKTILLLTVVVAVLVLGVVYAALTSDLTITANATVAPDSSNFNVAFTTSSLTEIKTLGADATTANKTLVTMGQSGQSATLTVAEGALKKVGDYVKVTYTVANTSKDLIANLGEIKVTAGDNSEYVTFTAVYGGETALDAVSGTTTVVVTATLIKAPSDAKVTATASIKFTATAAEA